MSITTKIGTTSPGSGGTYTQPLLNSLNWNVPLNTNFDIINQAIGGSVTKTFSNADVTLTTAESKNAFIICADASGAITANCKLIIPAGVSGFYMIQNLTTGAFDITVGNPTGTSVVVPKGQSVMVFSFGSNVVYANSGNSTPAGTIAMFGGASAPTGWVLCDGTGYSTTGAYANLYSAIGYTWGGSAGTFNVPDLRGMFVRGTGTNSAYPAAVGAAVAGYQADLYLNHDHTATSVDAGHDHPYTKTNSSITLVGATPGGGEPSQVSATTGTGNASITTTVATSTTGGTETRPKSYSMWYMIKY